MRCQFKPCKEQFASKRLMEAHIQREHADLLKKDTTQSNQGVDERSGEFEVEYLVERRVDKKGRYEYLVKWRGYSHPEDRTWETQRNLEKNASDAVDDFEKELLSEDQAAKLALDNGEVFESDLERRYLARRGRTRRILRVMEFLSDHREPMLRVAVDVLSFNGISQRVQQETIPLSLAMRVRARINSQDVDVKLELATFFLKQLQSSYRVGSTSTVLSRSTPFTFDDAGLVFKTRNEALQRLRGVEEMTKSDSDTASSAERGVRQSSNVVVDLSRAKRTKRVWRDVSSPPLDSAATTTPVSCDTPSSTDCLRRAVTRRSGSLDPGSFYRRPAHYLFRQQNGGDTTAEGKNSDNRSRITGLRPIRSRAEDRLASDRNAP